MLISPAFSVVNHLLRQDASAGERLRAAAGKVFRLEIAFATVTGMIDANGDVASLKADAAVPDVVIRIPAALLPRLLLGDAEARSQIMLEGDSAFAATLASVLDGQQWDVEENLSQVFGDVLARRIAATGTSFVHWQRSSLRNLLYSLAEFWTEEQPLVTGSQSVEEFAHEVDRLRDDLARLEKRVARMPAGRPTKQP